MTKFTGSVAQRKKLKLKIGMTGPSGSGKTYSALKLAEGIVGGDWSKVAVVDTENDSALYYSDFGPFTHIPFPPTTEGGYHPMNFVEAIKYAETIGVDCLIIDSATHEWNAVGGCLSLIEKINKGFTGWKIVTPWHNKFIDAMRESPLHIIACMRSATEYAVEQNDKGKAAPRKLGLKAQQREGTEYELGLVFDVEMNHMATASKDRTGIFADRGPFTITPKIGNELLQWANSGVELPQAKRGFDPSNDAHAKALFAALKKKFPEIDMESQEFAEIATAMIGKSITDLDSVLSTPAK